MFQLREKDLPDRELLERTRALVELLAPQDAWLIVNDRVDVARLAGAQGVHLGQDDLPLSEARRIAGPGLVLGASVHDAGELQRALVTRPHYIGLGTLFSSPTKPNLAARGLEVLRQLSPDAPVPIYGIGGVTPENAAQVIASGASGVAVGAAVLDAPDITGAATRLVEVVTRALSEARAGGEA